MSKVAFANVSCIAEAGAVIAGSEESTIDSLSLERVRLDMRRRTALPGGVRDLRPGLRGIVRDVASAAVFVEYANHIHLADLEASLGSRWTQLQARAGALPEAAAPHRLLLTVPGSQVVWGAPARPEWGQPIEISPRTVHALSVQARTQHMLCVCALAGRRPVMAVKLSLWHTETPAGTSAAGAAMQGMVVHDESAHPRQEAGAGAAKGGSWGARVLDWARDVRANLRAGHSAFLSMRENAAQGVQVGTFWANFLFP